MDQLDDPEIKEWHFHIYFNKDDVLEVQKAQAFKALLIDQVREKKFIVVCNGITSEILPGLNDSAVPLFNVQPRGPHPSGSFETWVPKEYLADALSFFTLHRNGLSIFIHPLTRHEIEDHTGRSSWLGTSWKLDLPNILYDNLEKIPLQYPELGLGHSVKT